MPDDPFLSLINQQPDWLTGQHIAISTRVRLARNLASSPFKPRIDHEAQRALVDAISASLRKLLPEDQLYELDALDPLRRQVLAERRLISPELASNNDPAACLHSDNESHSLMVNEEDHLRIQCLRPGLAIADTLGEAISLDTQLGNSLTWAWHERFGHLTTCPSNTGTGLRISVMLHLPGLAICQGLPAALRSLDKLNLCARGAHGEGSKAQGHSYQISNAHSLGKDEETIASELNEAVEQLIAWEDLSRKALLQERRLLLTDRVHRAHGLLSSARSLGHDELDEQCNWLRIGNSIGLTNTPLKILSSLTLHTQDAHLSLRHNTSDQDSLKRLRADTARAALS